MLYIYIINNFRFSGTLSVPVRLGYFGYRNIETIQVFECFRFGFGYFHFGSRLYISFAIVKISLCMWM